MRRRQRWEWHCHKARDACSYQELEEARRYPPLEPSEGAQPCQHLEFGLPASRTVWEYISVTWSHPVYGASLQRSWGTNTPPKVAQLVGGKAECEVRQGPRCSSPAQHSPRGGGPWGCDFDSGRLLGPQRRERLDSTICWEPSMCSPVSWGRGQSGYSGQARWPKLLRRHESTKGDREAGGGENRLLKYPEQVPTSGPLRVLLSLPGHPSLLHSFKNTHGALLGTR